MDEQTEERKVRIPFWYKMFINDNVDDTLCEVSKGPDMNFTENYLDQKG